MIALLIMGGALVCIGGGFTAWSKTGVGDELDQLTGQVGLLLALCGAAILVLRHAVLEGWIK